MIAKQNRPQLRFHEFDGEFEKTKFGKLYSFQTTNSLSRDKLNYEGGNVYNIHYGDIHTKFQPHFYLRNENVPYINGDVDLSKIKAELYCKTGDIIIADASEDYADIGKSIELIDIDNVKLLAGLHTLLARPISDKIFVGFTSYLLKSWTLRKQIMTIAQGSKVLSLSTGRVSNLELNIPAPQEQQKIASFLSAVDEKIQQLSRKKELLEQYKKGVMQQLFSGKLRFKPARPAGGDENGEEYPDWEEKKLGDVAQKIGDGLHGTPIYSEVSDIYFINGNNLINGKIEITEKTKKVDYIIFAKNDKGLNENTILISLNGTIGNISKYNNEKVMLGKSVGYFNFKENVDFYYHILKTETIQNFFISELTGSTIKNLSLKTLRETEIPFPCLEEQQKIAHFLSNIDTKIESASQQLNQTQSFKKGLLQQMFV